MEKGTRPLCWTCKHGMCIRQIERAIMVSNTGQPQEPVEKWNEDRENTEPKQTELKSDSYITLCFWNLYKQKDHMPIQLEEVVECNRYEEISSSKKELTKNKTDV